MDPNGILRVLVEMLDTPTSTHIIRQTLESKPEIAPDVVAFACPDLTYAPVRAMTERRCTGQIKIVNHQAGYGFISCPDLAAVFGNDVFVHKKQLGVLQQGQEVSFAVLLNKENKPQAYDLLDTVSGSGAAGMATILGMDGMDGAIGTGGPNLMGMAATPGMDGMDGAMGKGGPNLQGEFMDGFMGGKDGKGKDGCGKGKDSWMGDDGWGKDGGKCKDSWGKDGWGKDGMKGKDSWGKGKDGWMGKDAGKDGWMGKDGDKYGGKDGGKDGEGKGKGKGTDVVGTCLGVVKAINPEKGFGFISTGPGSLAASWGIWKDVYVHQTHMHSHQVGENVSFTLYMFQDQPQGKDLVAIGQVPEASGDGKGQKGKDGAKDGGKGGKDVCVGSFTGTIKSFNADKGYGFIASHELSEQGHGDAYIHSKNIGEFPVGATVAFEAYLHNGRTQARNLQAASGEQSFGDLSGGSKRLRLM